MRKAKTKGRKVKAKPLPLEINLNEYVELLKEAKHMRHKVAFMLGFESGMRISEIVNLKKADIEVKEEQIRINMGKNSKDRIVPLPQSWQEHHINYIPMPCKQRALQKALVESAERTGLKDKKPKVHFHSLRHGFATHCIRKNVPITKVQMLMGHEDPSTTSIYINLAPQEALDEYKDKFK
jgi:integrase/recombinase XerD